MATLKIIIASTRPGRVGLPIGNWIEQVAGQHGGFDPVEILDLAEIDLPFFERAEPPAAAPVRPPAHDRLVGGSRFGRRFRLRVARVQLSL